MFNEHDIGNMKTDSPHIIGTRVLGSPEPSDPNQTPRGAVRAIMTTADHSPTMGGVSPAIHAGATQPQFPPLAAETRPNVATDAAAFYLGRKPQTLRMWAMSGNGPIQPLRIHGRLAWPVERLRALCLAAA